MSTILDYLEHTAGLYPDKIAADDGVSACTWSELVCKARRCACFLSSRIQPRHPIALLMEKSTMTLTVMLGIVYTGCFYVIIDPSQPPERISSILRVLDTDLVITLECHEQLLDQAAYTGGRLMLSKIDALQTVSCDRSDSAEGSSCSASAEDSVLQAIRAQMSSSDILYGIFTSGSTGVPKGIVVSHQAVIDFIGHFTETFSIDEQDIIGNQAPFDFDVSVKDIYSCIFTGASLVMINRKLFSSPPMLLDYLCDKKVTNLTWAVSALTLVSALKGLRYKVPEYVRRVMFSGEVMPPKQLRLWQQALPEASFVNLYGPSEITCNCTWYPVSRFFEDDEKIPIGKAFEGRSVFLLDENRKRILHTNETGEICVIGESLAEGYYHNEKETADHFIMLSTDEIRDTPFAASKEAVRCYLTGDLGYLGEDGQLYFAGRKDFQIKHMGHRIELEEIEQAMNRVDGVEKSCCLMNEKKNQLAAFYQGSAEPSLVRASLKERLPVFMVPSKILQLEKLPLTKNGKTDRSELRRLLEKPRDAK